MVHTIIFVDEVRWAQLVCDAPFVVEYKVLWARVRANRLRLTKKSAMEYPSGNLFHKTAHPGTLRI